MGDSTGDANVTNNGNDNEDNKDKRSVKIAVSISFCSQAKCNTNKPLYC